MADRDVDVVVVGAGVAGLVAATDLVAGGREVVVVEARDRVGGRLLNTEIGGEPNELGGQWIAPYQTEMHALLAELGIELFHAYREGDSLYIDPTGQLHRYAADDEPLPATSAAAYGQAVAKLDALVRGARSGGTVGASASRRARRDHVRAVARRRGRRHARARLPSLVHGRWLHDEAGRQLLAPWRSGDGRRRRERRQPVRARPLPALADRRRLAADPTPARGAARRPGRPRHAGANASLERRRRRGRGRGL